MRSHHPLPAQRVHTPERSHQRPGRADKHRQEGRHGPHADEGLVGNRALGKTGCPDRPENEHRQHAGQDARRQGHDNRGSQRHAKDRAQREPAHQRPAHPLTHDEGTACIRARLHDAVQRQDDGRRQQQQQHGDQRNAATDAERGGHCRGHKGQAGQYHPPEHAQLRREPELQPGDQASTAVACMVRWPSWSWAHKATVRPSSAGCPHTKK